MKVSIGIMAYNEEQNILSALESIKLQLLKGHQVDEILVISSGSTDKTNRLVQEFRKKNKKVRLIPQKKRHGKASAVNLFLKRSRNNLLVLMSADLQLKKDTLSNMLIFFRDTEVGIVGSHPSPINNRSSFFGFAAYLLWDLHHKISLKSPKMGELIAFRKIFRQIPVLSAVDEANIESLIRGQGYKAIYAPKAVVFNKGPENLSDFIKVRRRVFAGHLATKYEYSYEVSTMGSLRILVLLIKSFKPSLQYFIYSPLVILLEGYCRILGYFDYKYKLKNHTVWDVTRTTKYLGKK